MCGIAGYIDLSASLGDETLRQHAQAMAGAMAHRGPDDQGTWADAQAGVALAQARLSIIDLSVAGHQPMLSASGRYVMVYNGEVYNAEDLRGELDGIAWRGHSDSEVILEGCARWGLKATVEKLIGMFAIALWDREERTLTLVRDRFGIKPLYWGAIGGKLLFGSELKALMALGGWSREIDRNALAAYLRFNYVPAPHSIFKGIRKLQPGHILTWSAGTVTDEASLVAARGGPPRSGKPAGHRRRRSGRSARSLGARCGAPAHGGRRSGGRVSFRRHRQLHRGRRHAGGKHRPRAHLFHRHGRARL